MTSSVSPDKYGIPQQQMAPYPAGANSARSASIALQDQATAKQMALIGGQHMHHKWHQKVRKHKLKFSAMTGGANGSIVVPPVPPTGVPDPGNQTANN